VLSVGFRPKNQPTLRLKFLNISVIRGLKFQKTNFEKVALMLITHTYFLSRSK
jgi:hypothetical protein